jgi:hypothetical protein
LLAFFPISLAPWWRKRVKAKMVYNILNKMGLESVTNTGIFFKILTVEIVWILRKSNFHINYHYFQNYGHTVLK